jgi:hypothetical protein
MQTVVADPHPPSRFDRPVAITAKQLDPCKAVRRPPDPFDLLEAPFEGLRTSEESVDVAMSMALSIDGTAVDDHVGGLAAAPPDDLRRFQLEGGRILFARTFIDAATSPVADRLRHAPLDDLARYEYEAMDAQPEHHFGAYDSKMHSIIFTASALPLNYERVSLHELGHARTLRGAHRTAFTRPDLLVGLPREIARLLGAYPQGGSREAVRERVLEALAEAYVWIIVGRHEELPMPLVDAVWGLLHGGFLPSGASSAAAHK